MQYYMEHLAGLTYLRFKQIVETKGLGRQFALNLWKDYYSDYIHGNQDAGTRKICEDMGNIFKPSDTEIKMIERSSDGVRKYLIQLKDKDRIETVYIPEEKRATACISSQAGCRYGCRFCSTGAGGFRRNLTTGEIVEQILQIQWNTKKKITNVVYMGMGEPFDNFDAVADSIGIISQVQGLAVAPRKITVSTAGHISGIVKMADGAFKASLAVSLHSPFADQRVALMPGTVKHPLDKLVNALEYYCNKTGKKVYFEYILIGGINDTVSHAEAVSEIMKRIPSKLNIIRYNQGPDKTFCKSVLEMENAFYYYIINKGFNAVFRKSRGDDVDAACGQLAVGEEVCYE